MKTCENLFILPGTLTPISGLQHFFIYIPLFDIYRLLRKFYRILRSFIIKKRNIIADVIPDKMSTDAHRDKFKRDIL